MRRITDEMLDGVLVAVATRPPPRRRVTLFMPVPFTRCRKYGTRTSGCTLQEARRAGEQRAFLYFAVTDRVKGLVLSPEAGL